MGTLSFCGIDVSKDRLDAMVLPEQQSSCMGNDPAGWAQLVEWLSDFSIGAIGLEASSGYERSVMRALLAAGLSVRQINPFKLRQFANASGVLAKNDRLDARMIASFIAVMPTRAAQRRTPGIEQMSEIVTVRRHLSDQKIAAENATKLLEDAMLQRLSRRRIAQLASDIAQLDNRLAEIVAADSALSRRYQVLTSMPGVGLVLACTLIALLPELGRMSRKQIAALVGVAPYDFDSGKLKGKRCIWGGRAPVRHVLYMAAMSAGDWNPTLKAFRHRLTTAGKVPKVTIVAVMRKMITTLNAMVRDDVAWADHLGAARRLHGSQCADRVGRVKVVAARSAGARSASLDATKSNSDLPATKSQLLIRLPRRRWRAHWEAR